MRAVCYLKNGRRFLGALRFDPPGWVSIELETTIAANDGPTADLGTAEPLTSGRVFFPAAEVGAIYGVGDEGPAVET
jgi:hypothetical protein